MAPEVPLPSATSGSRPAICEYAAKVSVPPLCGWSVVVVAACVVGLPPGALVVVPEDDDPLSPHAAARRTITIGTANRLIRLETDLRRLTALGTRSCRFIFPPQGRQRCAARHRQYTCLRAHRFSGPPA